jgi:CubicO group peptidase (beta-lactamase class C family)
MVATLLGALLTGSCDRALLGPSPSPPPPTVHPSALATLLDSLRYARDFPALAGAIVTDDSILEAQAVGSRRYAGPANITLNDRFHLGSDTKAMTAALMGVLVDDGLVSWTTTLAAVFPEYAGSMRPEYRDVTLRELLSHSGGFRRDPALPIRAATPASQRIEVLAWALRQPPTQPVGSYSYSNLGYILVGAIAERVTGQSYEALLVDRVLSPLGITTAGFGPMGTVGREDQPLQHTNNHAPIQPTADADNPPVYSPAGRVHMSIGDWARYIRWVLAAEAGHQTLLSPATAAMLTTPVVADGYGGQYALGWTIVHREWAGGRTLTHAGSNGLNCAVAWLAPGRRFAVIAATNQGPGVEADPLDPVAGRLIEFHLNGH